MLKSSISSKNYSNRCNMLSRSCLHFFIQRISHFLKTSNWVTTTCLLCIIYHCKLIVQNSTFYISAHECSVKTKLWLVGWISQGFATIIHFKWHCFENLNIILTCKMTIRTQQAFYVLYIQYHLYLLFPHFSTWFCSEYV